MKKKLLNALPYIKYIVGIAGLVLLYSCGTPRPYIDSGSDSKPDSLQAKKIDYQIFLIGDTGGPFEYNSENVIHTLQYQLGQAGDSSSVVFLGDNIYETGLNPDTTYAARQEDENIISFQLRALASYGGQSFFLPGNHDWENGIRGIRAQENFIESFPTTDAQFVPSNGCPGPNGFELGKNWYMITLDSDWWINHSFKPFVDTEGCEFKTRAEVMNRINQMVDEYSDKNILVAMHHSLFSNGIHAGYYSFQDYVFPLSQKFEGLYIPLPLIGSIYPLYRKLGQSGQDLPNDRYQEFKRQILEAVDDKEDVFFAYGHEHSLGFYQEDKLDETAAGTNHFILSGSGSKTTYARTGYGAEFVYEHKGFAKLVSYEDGRIVVEFWIPDNENKQGNLVYYKELIEPEPLVSDIEKIQRRMENAESPTDTIATVAAGPRYEAGSTFRAIWGDHYRDAWTTEVDIPVLDFKKNKGGLKVEDVSGGNQSVTVIVKDSTGQRYVLRSVQKNPEDAVPEVLQPTFVTDIAQDQISAGHPYGSIIVTDLANAAGVYDTNPKLVFVSKKSGLDFDIGNEEGTLFTLENFVSKEWFNRTYGKKATDIIDSEALWERLREGDAGTINHRQLLRSRLFDIFIGDWDRHERQWFWAEIPTDSSSVYEPIPLDRDNAFFKPDGAIPWIARRKWALREFQLFDEDIRDMAGLNKTAAFFDRWFMNELSKDEWVSIAEQLQQSLTDSVIVQAVEEWPEPIRELNGETFIKKLKARRDKMPEFARRYYNILSEYVNVFGSDKAELFEVERREDGQTEVKMYALNEDTTLARSLKYSRLVSPDATNEIRLYGFGEADRFRVHGDVGDGIKLRIIGGDGDDIIDDDSGVKSLFKKTLVYDTKDGSTINSAGEVQDNTSSDPRINRYERRSFEYDRTAPLITAGYNSFDGVFVGGGVLITKHGFRKEPFMAQHRFSGKIATQTSAFSAEYQGTFPNTIGPFDLELDIDVQGPNFSSSYFGLGNETDKLIDSQEFYRYRIDHMKASVGIANEIVSLLTVRGGVGYEFFDPSETQNRFVTSSQSDLTKSDFNTDSFANLYGGFTVSTVDDPMLPHYGVRFDFLSELKVGINDRSETIGRISSESSFYHTLEELNTTLAMRLGFATNIGDYNFFQANTLGGRSLIGGGSGNLRGYLRDRFSGRTSFYHNTELRTKLFDLESYLLPATVGVMGFFDEGRVWVNGESSDVWHIGYGGGLWISPLDQIVLTTGVALSKEETLFNVALGFNF
ncbi:MAG: BamA/TamA family outer membrane protein [Balneolaceae bacterium]|nr:BamA/TamA family outer membrane protein [Balneolaceae bacterium]